jgi:hypothetical protein
MSAGSVAPGREGVNRPIGRPALPRNGLPVRFPAGVEGTEHEQANRRRRQARERLKVSKNAAVRQTVRRTSWSLAAIKTCVASGVR